jgi:hypothetical protein
MKNVVFWDVALCRSCVDRRFGGTYSLHLQGSKIREQSTSMHPPANATASLSNFTTLKMEAPHSATSQKTTFFIVTAVKASNLTYQRTVLKKRV